jgi:hypothetical protein
MKQARGTEWTVVGFGGMAGFILSAIWLWVALDVGVNISPHRLSKMFVTSQDRRNHSDSLLSAVKIMAPCAQTSSLLHCVAHCKEKRRLLHC